MGVVGQKVHYARSGDVHIAYSVVGDGPIDVVFVPGFVSSVDLPRPPGHIVDRAARFARVIMFDKRGTGLSDRTTGIPDLGTRMDDVRAVMDTVGSERAAVFGGSEGGPMSILFAATFPDRTQSLTLGGSFATFVRTDDHPWMPTREQHAQTRAYIERHWGDGRILSAFFPRDQLTPEHLEYLGMSETRAASPGAADQLMAMNEEIDVRAILPTISVPTLVLHSTGDPIIPFQCGEYLAAHIPGARFRPIVFDGHATLDGTGTDWQDDFEEFVTGVRPVAFADRVLSTVLYTDIVGSTDRAASIGDAAWKQLLDRHVEVVGTEIERHRGVSVKHTGDGVLARFDAPARAVACGLAITQHVEPLGLEVRTGVHTGEIELRGGDIGGIAVHVGARVMAIADRGEVLVSRTVRDLVAGSGLTFADRGEHALKGVPDRWQLFAAAAS
jgi:class 3 adenylate cyclase/pimeloyl-ACP methyl ester carboxylesterase